MGDRLERAIDWLQRHGHVVTRAEFPPPPWPGLYEVYGVGYDLTEMQLINEADKIVT